MLQTRTSWFSTWARLGLASACLFGAAILRASDLEVPGPPPPTSRLFLYDYAAVIAPESGQRIMSVQQGVFEELKIPIVVVTIERMADFGYDGDSFDEFSRRWFDHWQIGSRGGPNKGILLLVSVGDRKVRIELGAAWGHEQDEYCQRVVDIDLLPAFKKLEYGLGMERAVESLASMTGSSAGEGPEERGPIWKRKLPMSLAIGCVVLGIALISTALYWERSEVPHWYQFETRSKVLITLGVSATLVGFIGMIALFALSALFLSRLGSGFGGGSSGGGGAGGDW